MLFVLQWVKISFHLHNGSCCGQAGRGSGGQDKIVGEADKVQISVVQSDSRSARFYLLQYDINTFSVNYL
jgi:hypothetical protein